MGLTMWPVPGKAKSKLICSAFAAGAPKGASGSVFFGTEGVMSAFQKAKSGTWWYIDNSYFDKHRGIYFRVTKNALQVDPRGRVSTGERFDRLDVPIRAWCDPLGEDTLLCPQSDDFMKSTLGLKDYDWTREVRSIINTYDRPDLPVRVRHWNRDKLKAAVVLEHELPHCRLVISHSSSASITALLEGVPSISTGPTAAAYHLTGPLTRESFIDPPRPSYEERYQFASVLADNQFTLSEFSTGVAWKWLEKQ
jgi:hypothetical protein